MRSILHRPPSASPTTSRPRRLGGALLAVLALVLGTGWATVTGDRDRVQLVVANPTACTIDVDLLTADASRLPIGQVTSRTERLEARLLDQQDTWTFRYRFAGLVHGEQTLTRADLVASGWRLTIPDEIGRRADRGGCDEASRNGTSGGLPRDATTP